MGSGTGDGRRPPGFSRWCHAGVWERVFDALTADRDNQYLMIDGTIVRAHQQAATGKGGGACDQALGHSPGGLTTKVHMLADALGRPLRFIITPGQTGDVTQAPALLHGQDGKAVLADKAYDSKPCGPSSRTWEPRRSSPQTAAARLPSLMTPSSTNYATVSSNALAASSTSAASPHAMTDAPSTSQASFTSQQQ